MSVSRNLARRRRTPIRHSWSDTLSVSSATREPAAALRIGEPLAFGAEFPVGARDRIVNLRDGDFGFHDGLAHLARQRPQIGGARRGIEGGAKRVPQTLKQAVARSALANSLREEVGKDGLHRTGLTRRAQRSRARAMLRHRFRP